MMAFNHCMKMVPLVGLGRRAVLPAAQQVRTLFGPWSRPSDIGALIRDMDRQMDRLEREMFRGLPSPSSFLPRLMPVDNTMGPQEGGQYRVSVDAAGFKPEEINISLDEAGRKLTITAKCERLGRDGSRYAQEMCRSLTLPEAIDVAKLKSTLHLDGILAIEAPFKAEYLEQNEPRSIPITRGGEAEQQQLTAKENASEQQN